MLAYRLFQSHCRVTLTKVLIGALCQSAYFHKDLTDIILPIAFLMEFLMISIYSPLCCFQPIDVYFRPNYSLSFDATARQESTAQTCNACHLVTHCINAQY
jgi:hypothetical protein